MVKRLGEIGVIEDTDLNRFLAESEDSVEKYKKRYSIPSQISDGRIIMDNLVELAVAAYEAGYITYEKLEYLLRISTLKPEDLGIEKKTACEFPSDDELDRIMEE